MPSNHNYEKFKTQKLTLRVVNPKEAIRHSLLFSASSHLKGSFRLTNSISLNSSGKVEKTTLTGKGGRRSGTGGVEASVLGKGVSGAERSLASRLDVANHRSEEVEVESLGTSGGRKHDWMVLSVYCYIAS